MFGFRGAVFVLVIIIRYVVKTVLRPAYLFELIPHLQSFGTKIFSPFIIINPKRELQDELPKKMGNFTKLLRSDAA